MKRPSLKTTLVGVVAGLFLTNLALSASTFYGLKTLASASGEITDNWMPSVAASKEMAVALGNMRLQILKHTLATDDAGRKKAETAIVDARTDFSAAISGYEALAKAGTDKKLIEDIKANTAKYDAMATDMIDMSANGMKAAAIAFINDKMSPVGADIKDEIDRVVDFNLTGARKSAQAMDAANQSAMLVTTLMGGIGALIAIGAIILIFTGVANPLVRITASMRRLAGGDTGINVPYAGRSDEIGAIADSVEIFRHAAIEKNRLEAESETQRRKAEADRIAAQEQAEADAAERLRIATSGLADGLRRMSDGDLSFQITEPFAPDFEQLRLDFNESLAKLSTALAAISGGISTMDGSTREIASGAGDLSRRTEQQAASLEETAAALDQIVANVSNSSKRTEEARSVANQANRSAAESAEVVAHAEEAMSRIETSSQQISNIIGVIDEIAFQTNLLALNAGVEAARAGDAGKGFAVVAQEVRELAQRSANAAKEIKGLIHNSSQEVQGGVKLVRDAGQALKTIVTYISEINGHMDAIATSAREQSTGLAEINGAVNSMDQSTQQNAAMVEQSTAASASLAAEAGRLRELIGRFRLSGNAQGQDLARMARTMAQPARSADMPVRKVANGGEWQDF